ncbi:MAG: type II secretion system F family protein [Pirellulaceae bacterium]|jgi:tight adherence protein C|nr:type II secretion system F family protein [Thermoguttaceae bacterium]NLZ02099.1 type II secretion system F family protein [Pirellulaceae bacterium]
MPLAVAFTFADLYPFAVFGMCAALAWWLMNLLAANKSRAAERLDELSNPRLRGGDDRRAALKPTDKVAKVLEKASPALAKPLQPKNDLELGKLKSRMTAAGFRGESAGSIFLGLKFAGLLVGLFLGGGTILGLGGVSQKTLMAAVAAAGLFFYLPDMVLWFIAKSRKDGLFLGLPDALDLMVVCVEAGLGLDQAMRKVAEEMRKTYPVIAEEFGIANFQLQMGRARNEVLHELGARTGVSDLRSLAAVLIQADKFGSSVAQALRVQSDAMRTRRRQMAEEKAAKTAVKLVIPLVLFIFPGIFVVLVGPAAVQMVREFLPLLKTGKL